MSDETTECPNGDCGVLLNRSDVTEDGGCRYCLQNSDALKRWAAAEPSADDCGGPGADGDIDTCLQYAHLVERLMPRDCTRSDKVVVWLAAEVRRLREFQATLRVHVDEYPEHAALIAERDQLRAEVEKLRYADSHSQRDLDKLRAERDEARAKVTKLRNLLSGALMDPG